jgi:hypothetical protein
MVKQVHRAFYFLVPGLFLLFVSPYLFVDGMFLDGVIYATVARNMAEGIGSFWAPQYTDTLFKDFFEHPPLAMGLESILFSLFGDHFLVERIYSLLSIALMSLVLVMIWRRISTGEERSYGWLPLLMILPLPLLAWTAGNNMLENTLSLFTSLSILFMIKSMAERRILNLFLAAFFLLCAFFTKGVVALFPLSFFFLMMLFGKDYSIRRFISDTIYLLFFFAALSGILFLTIPESLINIQYYFKNQVIRSLESVVTVNSRFHIIERLFMELLPAILLTLLIYFLVRPARPSSIKGGWKYVMLGLGLSATLPIMVSLKQRGFYIVPALPFFALAFSLIILPKVMFLVKRIAEKPRLSRVLVVSGYFLMTAAVALNLTQIGKTGRHQQMLEDVYILSESIPPRTILSSTPELINDYSLCAYLFRYGYISLERDPEEIHSYLLLPAEADPADYIDFEMTSIPLQRYQLLKLRPAEARLRE